VFHPNRFRPLHSSANLSGSSCLCRLGWKNQAGTNAEQLLKVLAVQACEAWLKLTAPMPGRQRNLAASQTQQETSSPQTSNSPLCPELPSGNSSQWDSVESSFSPAQSTLISSGKGREAGNKQSKTSATEFINPSQNNKQKNPSSPWETNFLHLLCLQESLKEKRIGHGRAAMPRSQRAGAHGVGPHGAAHAALLHAHLVARKLTYQWANSQVGMKNTARVWVVPLFFILM